MAEPLERWRSQTGLQLEGAFAFGDGPELADELLAYVERGTKRATAGSLAEQQAADEPFPSPGQRWGLLDGNSELRFVMETVEVSVGALGEVTPAFAWDEGEGDRTREDWLDGHRRFFARRGASDPDALQVVFERFRVVWPEPDEPSWLTEDVRELTYRERSWLREVHTERWGTTEVVGRGVVHDVVDLPALVCERDGERIGLCTFRPYPGGVTQVVSLDAFERGVGVGAALTAGLRELARRSAWSRLWLVTTNDNTPALRAFQRLGWEPVAPHRGSVDDVRRTEPSIPDVGEDGSQAELELELGQPNQSSRWSRS